MSAHLRDESYYNDLYDLATIERCLRFAPAEEKFREFSLYFIKGERYRNKSSVIKEWMDRDHDRDELFQNAREPQNIRCPNCTSKMGVILKELYELSGKAGRVLFMFECAACGKRKCVFDTGEEFKSKPESCPKCGKAIKVSVEERGKDLAWSKNCLSCGFFETEIDDYEKSKAEREETQRRNAELLNKHRAEFCFSDAEGYEYLDGLRRFEALKEFFQEKEMKEKDPDYKEAASLSKWTIAELEKALSEALEKEQYQKLSLDKPEIDKYVIVPFTVQELDSSRKEKESELKLQRVIKKTLAGSNWRLMSEGVSYRLG